MAQEQTQRQGGGDEGDGDGEAGLLVDLADDGVARVLAVVEPAARERPELAARDPGGQPAEQDLAVAHDDGVRRHPLHPLPRHGSNPRGAQVGRIAERGIASRA